MKPEEFMSLSMNEKLKTVNKMLEKEEKDHLKNVSEKIGIPYSAFTKIMRDNGNYQYNQTSKQYEKLMSLNEFEKHLQFGGNDEEKFDATLNFLEEHLDELKKILVLQQEQLVLDSKVYNPSSKTANKSLQVNADIFEQFTKLCSTQFPHFRQKDLISQSLLDFIRKYQKTLSE